MSGETKLQKLTRFLKERSEMGAALKRADPEAYQRINQSRIDHQHPQWKAGGRKRWRAVMMSQNADHHLQCARFWLYHGQHPEESGKYIRDQWLNELEMGEPCPRPFAPRR